MNKSLIFLIYFLAFATATSQNSGGLNVFDIARSGNVESMKKLIRINADTVNGSNDRGYTPLILASYYGRSEMVKLLIENGADVNFKSSQGTALCGVAYKGDITITKLLLKHGAIVNTQDNNGTSPLLYATLLGHTELAKLLLTFGANPSLQDNEGLTPIKCAQQLENIVLIDLFKSKL